MDISTLITDGIIIIGFIITGLWQKKKIDALKVNVSSLEKTISAQENALSAMEKAIQIVDIDKYQKHIQTFEALVGKNSKLTIELLEKEMGKQYETDNQKTKDAIKVLVEHYVDLTKFILRALSYIHPEERKQLVNELRLPTHKEFISEYLESIKEAWFYPLKYSRFFALSEFKPPEK